MGLASLGADSATNFPTGSVQNFSATDSSIPARLERPLLNALIIWQDEVSGFRGAAAAVRAVFFFVCGQTFIGTDGRGGGK